MIHRFTSVRRRFISRTSYFSLIMASFFDLAYQPDRSIRSKTTNEFISLPSPPEDEKVSSDWNVKPGDLLSWSRYRATGVFFVTPELTLLANPDSSGAGYLTIPLSISSLFPDVLHHYSSVLNALGDSSVTSIELSACDAFFIRHFSKEGLPESICQRNDLFFSFDPIENILFIQLKTKPDIFQEFPLETTKTIDLLDWIATIDENRTFFRVSYRFEGENISRKVPQGRINGLPAGWRCDHDGNCSGSSTTIAGAWKCQGPKQTEIEAKKSIEKHYEGFSVEIF